MNGAELLLNTLCDNGVKVCFANPGTSEMQFVSAVDRVDGMRCILALFEGAATGAADGYGRMLDRPASTLLHLGPGLANGLSNLHNAFRAQSPVVNIIGDHATFHRALDAPLTSDIEGAARPFSHWVRTAATANGVGFDTVAAVAAARSSPGRIASLIVPADVTWSEASESLHAGRAEDFIVRPARSADSAIHAAATMLQSGEPTAIILGGHATREHPLDVAGRIAASTRAKLFAATYTPRITRGAGRVPIERIPFPVSQAIKALAGFSNIILVGAKAPVAFFAYPDKPGVLSPPGARIHELAGVAGDVTGALEALAERLGAGTASAIKATLDLPGRPTGEITPEKIGVLLAAMLPTDAIVVDESITTGRGFLEATRGARPHEWILPTGGSIGYALPVATGAAVACPGRKVVVLESDGSGLYMPQTLWTHARESLNILTLVFANRKYQILRNEMKNVGALSVGPKASALLDIGRPDIDWVGLARSFGVEAARARSMEELSRQIDVGLASQGPSLIEVVL
jgi:acetolactate synthase I/II/III large subunit